jgi:hypothetical protein
MKPLTMKPLTKEQLRDNAAAMLAFADGKPIQFDASSYGATTPLWYDSTDIRHIHDIWHRPKPQPVSRPWGKPEDVPLVCWIHAGKGEPERLVTMVASDGIRIAGMSCDSAFFRWHELADGCEYSTDRKTWKPCTVEE